MTSDLKRQILLATLVTTINNSSMNIPFFLVAGLLSFTPAFAADSHVESKKPVIDVQQLNVDTDLSDFKAPDYRVHKISEGEKTLPTRLERNRAIKAAGLDPIAKDWDEVDRDVLYMRAISLSMNDLQKDYPKIKSTLLKRLKKEAAAKKAQ